jgi:hypothetical protein
MMKGNEMANLTAYQVLRLVANAKFRQMDSYDLQAFAGVDNTDALIHYSDEVNEEYTIILDGNRVCLVDEHGYESHYELGENILA